MNRKIALTFSRETRGYLVFINVVRSLNLRLESGLA